MFIYLSLKKKQFSYCIIFSDNCFTTIVIISELRLKKICDENSWIHITYLLDHSKIMMQRYEYW